MARTNKRVTGIIVREGKILLIQRLKNGDEYWVLPGGGVEEGETLDEAINREILEETGLKIIEFELLREEEGAFGDVYIYYHIVVEEGTPQLSGPEKEVESETNKFILTWVDIEKALKLEHLYPKITHKDLKNTK